MTEPFRRYEGGQPAAHRVTTQYHEGDDELATPLRFTVSEGTDPDWVPDAAFHDVAYATLAGLDGAVAGRLRQVDPALLLALARIVATLVLGCTESALAAQLARIKRRPHGLLAALRRAEIAAQLPERFGGRGDRSALAGALVEAGVAAADDRVFWARVFPK